MMVGAIASEIGASPSQVALAWIRHKDPTMVTIIGTRRLSQLHDNIASLNVSLSDDRMRRLDNVSAYPPTVCFFRIWIHPRHRRSSAAENASTAIPRRLVLTTDRRLLIGLPRR